MKKEVNRLLIIFISIIVLTGFISADGSCSIVARGSCNDYIVMGLSAQTNAHGEFPDLETYTHVLCCNFGAGDKVCVGDPPKNKIIGLSSLTNAHAEIPEEDNYDEDVCYDGLNCISTVEGCNTDYPMEVLTISDWTNAHIGAYGRYICCNKIECREGQVNYCSDYYQEECDYDPCNVGDASVELNTNITCGEGYICDCEWNSTKNTCGPIWEETKEPECGNNEIDSELDETCDGTDWGLITECSDFEGLSGDDLLLCVNCDFDTSQCIGEEGICGDGVINPGETCDGGVGIKTCADFGSTGDGLACHSPTHPNNCTFDTTGCEVESRPGTGTCKYDESTDDDCENKFLTYFWVVRIEWEEGNEGWDTNPDPSSDDYVRFNRPGEVNDDGKWHYDPNRALYNKCISDGTTIPCPAQIELPFFGSYSIVIIIALIVLVYVFLKLKEKEKLKKPSSKRKIKKK